MVLVFYSYSAQHKSGRTAVRVDPLGMEAVDRAVKSPLHFVSPFTALIDEGSQRLTMALSLFWPE